MNTINRLLTVIWRKLRTYPSASKDTNTKDMTTDEILKDITSEDVHKVLRSCSAIMNQCQNRQKMLPLIPHFREIGIKTIGLEMGGSSAANQRFVDFVIKALRFHRDSLECACCLYSDLDSFNPLKRKRKGILKYCIRYANTIAMSTITRSVAAGAARHTK